MKTKSFLIIFALFLTATSFAQGGNTDFKTIHIYVALCDNKYQGIVPVPKAIGNGQDPDNNLYWGCANGIRTYFKKSKEWKLLKAEKLKGNIMERLIFKHTIKNYYLVADAYNGQFIKQTTLDFLNSSAGNTKKTIDVNGVKIGIGGNAALVAYIGHNGLMDFKLTETFVNTDHKKRDVIILACASKQYFTPHLKQANVNPLVWTTNLMCPEAYSIHDALSVYVNGGTNEQAITKASLAYAKYQKCSIKGARGLLVTGW
ncbi:hypothetical protein EZJ43_08040 [Pedobacter changchengzhani]|uniref:Uncharacterized protein n=1 Tax=Pedobacter changchengzhani TaxID=2529274 RepID=A0A4R5MMU4_9SPHI|nr:hypothetical protein [Pedobacter changchengzhani]TDG36459.1 hypothetical protein EZJ43_08040 [Pedobacter changchengzhani]